MQSILAVLIVFVRLVNHKTMISLTTQMFSSKKYSHNSSVIGFSKPRLKFYSKRNEGNKYFIGTLH